MVGGAWRLGGRVPAARMSQGGYAMLAWQPNPRQMRTQTQKKEQKNRRPNPVLRTLHYDIMRLIEERNKPHMQSAPAGR